MKSRPNIQSTLADGKLTIPGDRREFVPARERLFAFDGTELQLAEGWYRHEDKTTSQARLSGHLELLNGESLNVAGWGDDVDSIELGLTSVPDGQEGSEWTVSVGFVPADWRASPDLGSALYVELALPPDIVAKLIEAWRAGALRKLSVQCETDLWIERAEADAAVPAGVAWYLLPSASEASAVPGEATGRICGLSWQDAGQDAGDADETDTVARTPAPAATDGSLYVADEIRKLRRALELALGVLILLVTIHVFRVL